MCGVYWKVWIVLNAKFKYFRWQTHLKVQMLNCSSVHFKERSHFIGLGVVFMEMYLQQYIRTAYLLCNKVSGSVSGDVLSLDIPGMFLRKANADWLSGTQYCHCFCRSDNKIYIIRWDIINHFFSLLQSCRIVEQLQILVFFLLLLFYFGSFTEKENKNQWMCSICIRVSGISMPGEDD